MERVGMPSSWDELVDEALLRLESLKLLRSLRPISFTTEVPMVSHSELSIEEHYEVFDEIQPRDRRAVEVSISKRTFENWILDVPDSGDDNVSMDQLGGDEDEPLKKLILFSGNDYLGLSCHPSISRTAMKAAEEHGMGPRGSALICGYTKYHRLLESSLADLKRKEECLICPTGFSANMAFMVALGNIPSLRSEKPNVTEKIAIFSDALNHASIIDGIRLAERQRTVEVHIYRHCDMAHLSSLLTNCKLKQKVVVTDGIFSMDGDFAPMNDLVNLRRQHGFLLVIDDAHGTFVCGKNGGGVAELFNCEKDVDICVGTLSKAAGCHGGFIACSKKWKQLIQSRGRAFIFSTSLPVPVVAAALAAVAIAKKESWRRTAIWRRVREFEALTGVHAMSYIISLVVGNEEKALQASRHLLNSGFHVTAIRPPTVPPNSSRLRVALSAMHTEEDIKQVTAALSSFIDLQALSNQTSTKRSRL